MKQQLYLLSLLAFILSSCWVVDATTVYNRSLTKGESYSEPISLSFEDNKKASFYFMLKRNMNSDQFILEVRWISPNGELLFNGLESTLKFLINKDKIITLLPTKQPRIASYRMEEGGFEEEAIYLLTREQMTELSNARSVSVELTGKYKIVVGTFNRFHTFRAFKDFLKNG